VEIFPATRRFEVLHSVSSKNSSKSRSIDPLFVALPKELVPLAKQNSEDNSLVDVFELIINGAEIAPGYASLTIRSCNVSVLLEQGRRRKRKRSTRNFCCPRARHATRRRLWHGHRSAHHAAVGAESIRDVIPVSTAQTKEINLDLRPSHDGTGKGGSAIRGRC